MHLVLLRLLGLDDVLHNLGLLNQEGADHTGYEYRRTCILYVPSANAVGATAATVRALHGLLALRERRVGAGAHGLHTGEGDVAVTALRRSRQLREVKVAQLAAGGLDDPSAVRLGVVGVTRAQSEPLSHLL